MKRNVIRTVRLAALLALAGAGCAGMQDRTMSQTSHTGRAASMAAPTSAAELRTGLNALFAEHVYLAAAATNAALGGRAAEFEAAAGALDANSVDIAKAIGSVYGPDAEKAFLPLWRRHIGFVVDYTAGMASNDKPKQDRAVSDLLGYTEDFGAFLNSANPNLPKSVVADLVKHHIVTLKEVIDAQAAKDTTKAWMAAHTAAGHMQMIADPMAAAIVKQFPDRFAGPPGGPASDLRVAFNTALREHAYLAAIATNAALGGRAAEFEAAAGALDANSVDLAKAIGSVYGPGAGQAFLPLWRRHIGFFVDYAVGLATRDKAKQDKAVGDLLGYTEDFGAFLNSANPNLPKKVVADLVRTHVLTLKDVVDAQGATNQAKAWMAARSAAAHMQMIADPLAAAIAKQFPQRYAVR